MPVFGFSDLKLADSTLDLLIRKAIGRMIMNDNNYLEIPDGRSRQAAE